MVLYGGGVLCVVCRGFPLGLSIVPVRLFLEHFGTFGGVVLSGIYLLDYIFIGHWSTACVSACDDPTATFFFGELGPLSPSSLLPRPFVSTNMLFVAPECSHT